MKKDARYTAARGIYAEVESSAGDLNTQWKELRDSVVDDFYKQVGYEPLIKDYNNFEYKNKILYFIKDGEKIQLNNAKERGKCLALSTLKSKHEMI